ncbi:MAG: APC family permease, partial [Acidobacteria bacterium]|nr:APC family permease [Acidobacteriota bacterium]
MGLTENLRRITSNGSEAGGTRRKLTLWPLVGATYLMVAGGPYGLEDLVQLSGYSAAIIILLLTPLLWSLPIALMVAELATAIPEEGGFYVWVRRGMGPFWGFQEAWLTLVASIFDMAIYPTLFALYLGRIVPSLDSEFAHIAVSVAVIAACAAFNLRGARTVGNASVVFMLALLGPFVLLIAYGFFQRGAATSAVGHASSVDYLGGFVVAMWNYMAWDSPSTIAGEVHEPHKTYPRAMLIAMALVVLMYVLPVAAVSQSGIDPASWQTGGWVDVARTVVGPGLALAVMAGGMISALGQFNALVLSYSRLPLVLAEDGFLPKFLARVSPKTGVPWVSVIACSIGWALCLKLGFEKLLSLSVMLTGSSILLEFLALIALRIKEPKLARPFRVPGGIVGAIALVIGPTILLTVAFARNRSEQAGPI